MNKQKKWKIKATALEILEKALPIFQNHSPKQVSHSLAILVQSLVGACKEPRSEVKNVAGALLHQVAKMVKCVEIKNISERLVSCLTNFGNTQLASETL